MTRLPVVEPTSSRRLDPELSAERVLTRAQAIGIGIALAGIAWFAITAPATAVVALITAACLFAAATTLHYIVIAAAGVVIPQVPLSAAPLADDQLPRYTVLAPLYKEAAVVAGLVSALDALDYPKHLLDVKLIVRCEDHETLEALEAILLPSHFEVLRLPPGKPQTKPRACNFGLSHARGELVVVFDAEDQPEPGQLRKAAAALASAPPDVACVQAKLHVWNPTTSPTARYGAAEFAHTCEVLRPGLERLRAPIPLCGTSNHFSLRMLRELGGLDEYNVAEDADLGIRLARAGYRARLLDSKTYEEANTELPNWIRQRSRWIKGWLQTWLVHNRHPVRLVRDLGIRGAVHLQLTMLAQVIPTLTGPVIWALPILWALSISGLVQGFLPTWLLLGGTVLLGLMLVVDVLLNLLALRRAGHRIVIASSLLVPVYGLIKSFAAAKGICQLITSPHYWEKTDHGMEADQIVVSWSDALAPEPAS